jgi:hypothetical protein
VTFLLKIYAQRIGGQDHLARQCIEDALGDPDEPETRPHSGPKGHG